MKGMSELLLLYFIVFNCCLSQFDSPEITESRSPDGFPRMKVGLGGIPDNVKPCAKDILEKKRKGRRKNWVNRFEEREG